MSTYGDISPRTAAYAVKNLLERAHPAMITELFGVPTTLPTNSTKSVKWRRYNALPKALTPLTEGVAPTGSALTATDVTLTLQQYGAYVPITDVILDTHEDPVLHELTTGVIPQQAAETIETIRLGALKSASNVFYAGGVASRATVASAFDLNTQRKIVRALARQNAKKVTKVVKASVNIATEPVAASFICIIHPDLVPTIRSLTGFVPTEKYAGITPWDMEIGKVEDVRYLVTTLNTPYADAGATSSTMISTTGTNADVYPMLFFGADAFGIVALKGKFAADVLVNNPKAVKGDELAQYGSVGWKTMQGAAILNDAWFAVCEVAAPKI